MTTDDNTPHDPAAAGDPLDTSKADTDAAPSASGTGAEPAASRPLRREAIYIATERQRIALIAVCCSLAGLGVGFGMGQLVSANNNSCAHRVTVSHLGARAPLPQPDGVTWLGVEVASHRGAAAGARVVGVVPGSPAKLAGLRVGDTIVSLDGTTVRDSPGLVSAVRQRPMGRPVSLVVMGPDGQRRVREVILGSISPRDLRNLTR